MEQIKQMEVNEELKEKESFHEEECPWKDRNWEKQEGENRKRNNNVKVDMRK